MQVCSRRGTARIIGSIAGRSSEQFIITGGGASGPHPIPLISARSMFNSIAGRDVIHTQKSRGICAGATEKKNKDSHEFVRNQTSHSEDERTKRRYKRPSGLTLCFTVSLGFFFSPRNRSHGSAVTSTHPSLCFGEYNRRCAASKGNKRDGEVFKSAGLFPFIINSATGAGEHQSAPIVGLMNILVTGYTAQRTHHQTSKTVPARGTANGSSSGRIYVTTWRGWK